MTAALLHNNEFSQEVPLTTSPKNENRPTTSNSARIVFGATAAAMLVGGVSAGVSQLIGHGEQKEHTNTTPQDGAADPLGDVMYPESSVVGKKEIVQDGPGVYDTALDILEDRGINTANIDLGPTLSSSEDLGITQPGQSVVVVETDTNNDGRPEFITTTPNHIHPENAPIAVDLPTIDTH